MKYFFTYLFLFVFANVQAQKFDSIYVHLYTDSLKKGTYNYINIDGKLENGRYLPLDSSNLIFSASDGKFFGNSLWVPADFKKNKVTIRVVLRGNSDIFKSFDLYIKQQPDPELKSEEELIKQMEKKSRKKRG